MNTLKSVLHYVSHLEWTEKVQDHCIFCDPGNLKEIVYRDDTLVVLNNIRSAGETHWLIMPAPDHPRHVRDIESLTPKDLPLLQAMEEAKKQLLARYCPGINPSKVHSGYHRGRRPLLGSVFWPDVVSVHHLHLHVIVRPRLSLRLFKYPTWLPLMWVGDQDIIRKLAQMKADSIPSS